MKKFAVVVATLMRPSLSTTIDSIRKQVVKGVEVYPMVRYDPKINEYASRDLAVQDTDAEYIAFLDDDAYYPPGILQRAYDLLQEYEFVDGAIRGNVFNRGEELFDYPYLSIGTAMFMTRGAYDKAGGFRLDWGRLPDDGWRMDTAILYSFLRNNRDKGYIHAGVLVVNHPNVMQSQWNPLIEWQFYRDYQKYVEKYILPLDGRLPDMIKHGDILDAAVKVLGPAMNDIILKYHRGVIVEAAYNELAVAIKSKGVKK